MEKKIIFTLLATCFLLEGFTQSIIFSAGFQYKLLPGTEDSVYEGYVEVFENRNTNTGKKIRLYTVIVPAIYKANQAPLFIIDGGPGVAATNGLSFYAMKENPYRQYRDLVLVDVRGTGKSNPLNCVSLQLKKDLQQHLGEMYPEEAVKDCYKQLSHENDLTQYHTTNVVSDLEEVRKHLGYTSVSLLGLSYGTRVALQYMRMYPKSLESVVLWSPTSTYSRMPLYHAKFAQNALDLIWEDCGKDTSCSKAYPGISENFVSLMNKWKKKPVLYSWVDAAGKSKTVSVSWDGFQTKIRSLMYTPAGIRSIPYLVNEAWKGNLKPFMNLFPKKQVMSDFIAEGFYLCVSCTEDVPFINNSEIKKATDSTFMGSYRVDQQRKACANWTRGDIPADFLQPVSSAIPTLILSGRFDPVTPTSMAKEIMKTLPAANLVVIPYMSHVIEGLSSEHCFDQVITAFLDSPEKLPDADCVKEMLPPAYKVATKGER